MRVHPPLTVSCGTKTATRLMRGFGKNVLRKIHVIEAMCFDFSQNAVLSAVIMSSDDDCLTKANANHTNGKLKDVRLLQVGAKKIKLKEQTCLKLARDLPILGLPQERWSAILPIDNEV